MRCWTKIPSNREARRGFTLLEVMVSVAILAVTIIPMLLLREESYEKAYDTKMFRVVQTLAQYQLSNIAMEVRTGDGSGDFEGYPEFRYEYRVTLYDFGAGVEEDEEQDDRYFGHQPDDSVFPDEDAESYGPMVMRHVELTVFFPSMDDLEEGYVEKEYVIDTYIPVLLTEEQFDYKMEEGMGE
jgi:prepilin-type N-terminal cleavage/methylation domain-containing protein